MYISHTSDSSRLKKSIILFLSSSNEFEGPLEKLFLRCIHQDLYNFIL